MKKAYVPPQQGFIGQIFDSVFILALVYASLLLPLLMKTQAVATEVTATETIKQTWDSLGQNAIQQAQWIKLGFDADKAAAIINTKVDYSIDPAMLIVTILVIAGYFVFMLKVSDKEYREVISEKFDT